MSFDRHYEDLNPLFVDEEYASGQPLGRRPGIDALLFSLAVGMSVADRTGQAIANLEYESVTFVRPPFPGAPHAKSEVLEKRESAGKPDRGIGAIETRAFNQNKNRERIVVLRRRYMVPN